jgi:hypothetical protein
MHHQEYIPDTVVQNYEQSGTAIRYSTQHLDNVLFHSDYIGVSSLLLSKLELFLLIY